MNELWRRLVIKLFVHTPKKYGKKQQEKKTAFLNDSLRGLFLVVAFVSCYSFAVVGLVGLWVGWYGLALALVW
jgi:uncharacterized membrane protein (DUF106 family)